MIDTQLGTSFDLLIQRSKSFIRVCFFAGQVKQIIIGTICFPLVSSAHFEFFKTYLYNMGHMYV